MSYRPPDISQSVTHVSSKAIIDAPLQIVWHAILDFPSYEKWNPVVRSQVITDNNLQLLEPQPKPSEGAHLLMRVSIPPAGLDPPESKRLLTSHEVITIVDERDHRVGWTQVSYPRWLVETHRLQEVTEVEVDGKKITKYSTLVTFNGPVAWIVRFFFLGTINTSFDVMTKSLKDYTEQLARQMGE